MLELTLGQIRAHRPCAEGWGKLLNARGFSAGGFDPAHRVTLGDVAASNGAADAWWCVRCLDWSDIAVRRAILKVLMFSVKRASAHTRDRRVHDCIATIDRWLAGDDTTDLLTALMGAAAAAAAAVAARREASAARAADAAVSAVSAATRAVVSEAWAHVRIAADKAVCAAVTEASRTARKEYEQQKQDLIDAFGRTMK